MKRFILIFSVLIILLSSCTENKATNFSIDQELYRVEKRGKWGFINSNGDVIIKPKYNWALDFSEGLAPVGIGKKMGYINKKGEVVIEPQFDFAGGFYDGVAIIILGKNIRTRRYGGIDIEGNIVIEPEFQDIFPFSDGLATALKDDRSIYIDKKGNTVIDEYDNAITFSFAEGLAVIEFGDKYGFIDKEGKIVIEPKFEDVYGFSEGLSVAKVKAKDYPGKAPKEINAQYIYGYIDKTGEFVIEPQFTSATDFKEEIAIVSIGDERMAIDKGGNILFKFYVEEVYGYGFREGLLPISLVVDKKDGMAGKVKWGYMDKNGEIVIRPQFDEAEGFYKGVARVRVGKKWGYINTTGEYIWKPTK